MDDVDYNCVIWETGTLFQAQLNYIGWPKSDATHWMYNAIF